MRLTRPTSAEHALDFRACDTSWRIVSDARAATHAAYERVRELARALDAFDPASRVAQLHRDGSIVDADIARLVARAEEYRERTDGVFDVGRGAMEHALKSFIRGETDARPAPLPPASYRRDGSRVTASAPLDLNGLAKGYIVDAAHRTLVASGARGFVDGGGDIAGPTGPVAIASPYEPDKRIGVLDTRWHIATSGNSRRRRAELDHLYDARDGRIGARHDQVTVVAKRDCMEADALATAIAVLPLEEGRALLDGWNGAEALWVTKGKLEATEGFDAHVWRP